MVSGRGWVCNSCQCNEVVIENKVLSVVEDGLVICCQHKVMIEV